MNILPRKPAWLSQKSNVQKLPTSKLVFEHCTFTTLPTIQHQRLHIRTNRFTQGFGECSNVRMFKHSKPHFCPKYRLSQCTKIVVKSIVLLSNLWYTLPLGVVLSLPTLFFHNLISKKSRAESSSVRCRVGVKPKARVRYPPRTRRCVSEGMGRKPTTTPAPHAQRTHQSTEPQNKGNKSCT